MPDFLPGNPGPQTTFEQASKLIETLERIAEALENLEERYLEAQGLR
jgi:hypothetical protein